jgi:hypothetical protein
MSQKKLSILFIVLILMSIAVVAVAAHTPVQAQTLPIRVSENNCTSCHENLYFLHDTGNWFCLRESPMTCVDCHGGDPEAVTQELAHSTRAAHPVINEDVSKCQECHPDECDERVEIFDQTAGISQVRVAAPYPPARSADSLASVARTAQTEERPGGLLMVWEIVPLVVIAGLALVNYLIYRAHHQKPNEKE